MKYTIEYVQANFHKFEESLISYPTVALYTNENNIMSILHVVEQLIKKGEKYLFNMSQGQGVTNLFGIDINKGVTLLYLIVDNTVEGVIVEGDNKNTCYPDAGININK